MPVSAAASAAASFFDLADCLLSLAASAPVAAAACVAALFALAVSRVAAVRSPFCAIINANVTLSIGDSPVQRKEVEVKSGRERFDAAVGDCVRGAPRAPQGR